MSKKFNPLEWANKPAPIKTEIAVPKQEVTPTYPSTDNLNEVEKVIQQIESNQLDIASAYADWRNIGFAFADEFGENGRDYFHRISRFYSDYSQVDCNAQFDNCLKSKGQGVSLKTFFFHAKQAGVKFSPPQMEESFIETELPKVASVPTLPDSIFNNLPDYLKRITSICTSAEERDIMLLGSIVAISACLPKLFGRYAGNKLYPNLFLFITAQASAGKGRLILCKLLVNQVHLEFRQQAKQMKQQYEVDLNEYNASKGSDSNIEKPQKPPEKMLFIPANNSSTGAYQLLNDSEGKGLIFETEGDTLAKAFKSDYGDYSDGFRKAFHHETIAYYRRTDRELVEIDHPRLSAVLSGTPMQISALIPSAENGLFSRFLFYFMNIKAEWKDVFEETTDEGLEPYFEKLGEEFYDLYQSLQQQAEVEFSFSPAQKQQFNQYFTKAQDQYIAIQGLDYMASIRRSGVIAFRIAMVISALRIMETGEVSNPLICTDQDFETTLSIVSILLKHSSKVFSELPSPEKPKLRKNRKQKYLEVLPQNFNRQDYLLKAKELNIPEKTAEGYITQFVKARLIHREKQDCYINLEIES
jgi:hypothetical protein